jgi:putative DNA methylase
MRRSVRPAAYAGVESSSTVEFPALQLTAQPAGSPARSTLLESGFPFAEASAVAQRDRYCRDHAYSVHKWWARRPPAVIRSLLLAAALPATASREEFWEAFASQEQHLADWRVGDPFMGGATTLVEASRLGAQVVGIDVDPLAVRIAAQELDVLDVPAFEDAASQLLRYLQAQHGDLYPVAGDHRPLHHFWLRRATCLECGEKSMLYRNLWLVRDRGLPGAVVRDSAGVAFCPDCLSLHHLRACQKQVRCCRRHRPTDTGTYQRARFTCPGCGAHARNDQLKVGRLERVLLAIEDTVDGGRRELRPPTAADQSALIAADAILDGLDGPPTASLADVDSGRPAAYGFKTVADLFSSRQQIVFAAAFAWIRRCQTAETIRRALSLSVSNALGSNNLLCGYATDYGRLSSLFSGVRAYSMPVLSVELNPLHPTAGRGTLAMTLGRMARSGRKEVRRHCFDTAKNAVVSHSFSTTINSRSSVMCRSADRPLLHPFGKLDIVVTDPPYFDFIPYSDLSLLYRAWPHGGAAGEALGGAPIYPVGENPADEFARRLGRAFANVRGALKPGALMTFTYHSSHEQAWTALEEAIKQSGFAVTAVFPVWADGRSGGHGHAGNCEWDLVFVCRPATPTGTGIAASCDDWLRQIQPTVVEDSDRRSMELGLAAAKRLSV